MLPELMAQGIQYGDLRAKPSNTQQKRLVYWQPMKKSVVSTKEQGSFLFSLFCIAFFILIVDEFPHSKSFTFNPLGRWTLHIGFFERYHEWVNEWWQFHQHKRIIHANVSIEIVVVVYTHKWNWKPKGMLKYSPDLPYDLSIRQGPAQSVVFHSLPFLLDFLAVKVCCNDVPAASLPTPIAPVCVSALNRLRIRYTVVTPWPTENFSSMVGLVRCNGIKRRLLDCCRESLFHHSGSRFGRLFIQHMFLLLRFKERKRSWLRKGRGEDEGRGDRWKHYV